MNNAGVAKSARVGSTDDAMLDAMLAVNLAGAFRCVRAALPALLEAPQGRIVNVASTAGLVGYPYVAAYCATKHGLVGFTRALALELASTRVTVNAVCPGYTDTDIVARGGRGGRRAHRTHRGAGARGARVAQSAEAAGRAGGSGRGRGLAVPARVAFGDRPGDRDRRRRDRRLRRVA